MYSILVRIVDVLLRRRDEYLRLVVVLALRGDDAEISVDLVVAFRAPGDVVHVGELRGRKSEQHVDGRVGDSLAYGVDVEHGDVRRGHEEVLHERGDQVPWVELAAPGEQGCMQSAESRRHSRITRRR